MAIFKVTGTTKDICVPVPKISTLKT